jgi:Catechol dioxygenase N terminus
LPPKLTPPPLLRLPFARSIVHPIHVLSSCCRRAVKHLYAFAREVDLTTNELIKLAEILTEAGKISDASRHEFLLMSDVMGLTMVVDCNTNRKPDGAFESSVLGPFYRADAPWIDIGGDICRQKDVGTPALVSGRVLIAASTLRRSAQRSAIPLPVLEGFCAQTLEPPEAKKSQDSHHLSGSYNPLSDFCLEPLVSHIRFKSLHVKPFHSRLGIPHCQGHALFKHEVSTPNSIPLCHFTACSLRRSSQWHKC